MQVSIKLNFNNGYQWFSKDGIYVKGYCFDENNILWDEEKLVEYFLDIDSESKFQKKLLNVNGIFSVIIQKNDSVFFATDRTRTFPIFYTIENNELYISDDTYYLRDKFNKKIDNLSSQEYLATGYVTGKETLLENIYQVQAGEYIIYKNNILNNNNYSDYITISVSSKSFNQLKKDFLDILDRSILRLIEFADGRQIVVPLSGGYDSRLIVALLKKHNYKNIFCFTYGKRDSFEVEISQKVANNLGYDWYFVEYSEETIPFNYIETDDFNKYFDYSSNHVSKPHLQDYFAVKYLKENKLISQDAIFVPGHSGDFLGGSHIGKTQIASIDTIINIIIKKHYTLNTSKYIKEIESEKLNYLKKENKYFYSVDDNFNLKERQSKFIVNANRVYEFYDYQHLIPLWDKELISFFKTLPLEYKVKSYFYEKVIIDNIFKTLDINYMKSAKKDKSILSSIKNIFKKSIPKSIKKILIEHVVNKNFKDINNFQVSMLPIFKKYNQTFKYSKIELLYVTFCLDIIKERRNRC